MQKTIAVVAVLAVFAVAQADENKIALIEEMLVLSRMEEMTKVSQLEGFKVGLSMAPAPIPEATKARIIAEGVKAIEEVMPWSKMKHDFVELFSKHYTTEELETIVDLCKDPRYKVLVAKQIEIIGPSMEIGQKYGKLLATKMMQSTMKIMQEP